MIPSDFYKPTEADRYKFKDMSIAVLQPCFNFETPVRSAACLMKMIAYSHHFGLPIYSYAYTERTVVDWARNILGRTFLDGVCEYTDKPYTHALWIDDDQVYNPDMACRLAALGHLDMVSALYCMRERPHWPVAYLKDDSDNPYKHWPMAELPPMAVEVDAVGFGALLMKREVLERTPEPWFTIDARGGEDIVFCKHAKEAGFRVWLAGDYRIGHLSGHRQLITTKDFEEYRQAHPDEVNGRVRIELEVAQ